MTPTATFFHDLGRKGHEPLLEKASGTIRFELVNGKRTENWIVTLDKGDVAVSHGDAIEPTDSTLRTRQKLFDGMVTGDVNPMAAFLRGAVTIEGDAELFMLLRRLFPGPPNGAANKRGVPARERSTR